MRIVLAVCQALIAVSMIAAMSEQVDKARAWATALFLASSTGLYLAVSGDESSARFYVLLSLVAASGLANANRETKRGL